MFSGRLPLNFCQQLIDRGLEQTKDVCGCALSSLGFFIHDSGAIEVKKLEQNEEVN